MKLTQFWQQLMLRLALIGAVLAVCVMWGGLVAPVSAESTASVPVVSLSPRSLNFGNQQVKSDPEYADRYILETSDATAYPEVLCWTTQGFNNRMAAAHDSPDLWRWERPRLDLVRFRMTRSL